MRIKVENYGKFKASINFLKQQKNWNEMVWVAMNNVADDIRDDAEAKLYEKRKRVTGKSGKSIKTVIKRQGNYTYISLTSDHPGMGLMEYGGEVADDVSSALDGAPYSNLEDYTDNVFAMTYAIKKNQADGKGAFREGGFAMTRALREGLPDLESEIMRTYHRMKPK